MSGKKLNFTKAALERITPPTKPEGSTGGKFDTYHDTGEKGLVLLVSNGGAKTFYVYKRIKGKPKRVRLGAFPDLSIENARKAAQTEKGLIAQGIDPVAEKKRVKDDTLLYDFYHSKYLPQHAKLHNKAWEYDAARFEQHLKPLHKRRLGEIQRDDIRQLHNDIAEQQGIYCANRVLANIHSIFNKAIEWDWRGINPAQGIKKFKEKSRERFLQPEELPLFFAALEAEPNSDMRDYFMMLLLTGARRRNVAAMRWKDISLDLASWTIPETKNGESYTVNLPQEALALLKSREHTKAQGWVFPSVTSKSGHIEEPKAAWKRLLLRATVYHLLGLIAAAEGWKKTVLTKARKDAETNLAATLETLQETAERLEIKTENLGLQDLRIHDLRRTLGSYQAISGASSFIIGKSLGHKSSAATEIYARLNADPVRESVEKALSAMFAVGKNNGDKA